MVYNTSNMNGNVQNPNFTNQINPNVNRQVYQRNNQPNINQYGSSYSDANNNASANSQQMNSNENSGYQYQPQSNGNNRNQQFNNQQFNNQQFDNRQFNDQQNYQSFTNNYNSSYNRNNGNGAYNNGNNFNNGNNGYNSRANNFQRKTYDRYLASKFREFDASLDLNTIQNLSAQVRQIRFFGSVDFNGVVFIKMPFDTILIGYLKEKYHAMFYSRAKIWAVNPQCIQNVMNDLQMASQGQLQMPSGLMYGFPEQKRGNSRRSYQNSSGYLSNNGYNNNQYNNQYNNNYNQGQQGYGYR